jgi:hypothetical protein
LLRHLSLLWIPICRSSPPITTPAEAVIVQQHDQYLIQVPAWWDCAPCVHALVSQSAAAGGFGRHGIRSLIQRLKPIKIQIHPDTHPQTCCASYVLCCSEMKWSAWKKGSDSDLSQGGHTALNITTSCHRLRYFPSKGGDELCCAALRKLWASPTSLPTDGTPVGLTVTPQ